MWADHFYDTSAAISTCMQLGTANVDSLFADGASRHSLSTLGVVEARSVFARLGQGGLCQGI